MIKKFVCLALCLCVLSSCTFRSEAPEVNGALPMVIITEDNGEYTANITSWEDASLTEITPVYVSGNASVAHPYMWDGNNMFVLGAKPDTILDEAYVFMEAYTSAKDFFNTGAQLTTNRNKITHTITWVSPNGEERETVIPQIDTPKSISDRNILSDCELKYAAIDGTDILLFFLDAKQDGTLYLVCVKVDGNNKKEPVWTKGMVDEWYVSDVRVNATFAYIDSRLYISASTAIFAMDVRTGEIYELIDVVERAKDLIPESSQISPRNTPVPITIEGAYEKTFVFYLPVYAKDNSEHALYFAVKNDAIAGAVDCCSAGIKLYNADLVLQSTITDFNGRLAPFPVAFPKVS